MQDMTTFCQSNGYHHEKFSPNVLTMQLRAWSPPSYFRTRIKRYIPGVWNGHWRDRPREVVYLAPPFARWRAFFEEKMQVGLATHD